MLLKSGAVAILLVATLAAQPAFEVASIKPSDPDTQLHVDFAAGGRLIVTHATLRFLIKIAYDISDDQLSGGPGWINSTRFDVQGKPPNATGSNPETHLRLQRLLADRFQLEMQKDSKPMPIFALVAAKNGPKMKRTSEPGDSELKTGNGRGVLAATRVDMPALVRFLSDGQTGRPVVDMTGLTGRFDFRLEWTPDSSLGGAQATPVDPGGISIFTALQQQLGLRLDPRTGASDYFVVTRAELPSAN
jgi:bla regulator protein blaR1